jgi:membrane-associated phospholipid phosphatase
MSGIRAAALSVRADRLVLTGRPCCTVLADLGTAPKLMPWCRLMMPPNSLHSALQTAKRPLSRFARSSDAVIVALLVLTVLATVPDNRRLGSTLQVVLPLIALGCAATQGKTVESLGRFAVLEAGVKGVKYLLGATPVGQRPDGGDEGFPSGHTAVATFGAVQTIKECAALHPVTKAAVVAAAALTGGSRIESGRHNLWQTMAGAFWGWAVATLHLAGFRGAIRRIGRIRGRHA